MKIDGYYVLEENQYNQDRFKELDWVKIDVKTLSKVLSNRKTKYDYSKEFLLTIDVSKKINEKDIEINNFLQSVFSTHIDNYYYYAKKEYVIKSYYLRNETALDSDAREKSLTDKLNKVYDFFKVYEKVKTKEVAEYLKEYSEDINNNKVYNTSLFKVFPKEINGNKEYIVLLTGFVEKDFFTFKTNSKYMSKVMDHDSKEKIKNEVDSSIKDFLISTKDVEEYSDKSLGKYYFVVNPNGYSEIKKIINRELQKEKDFKSLQEEVVMNNDLTRFDVVEDNLFELKIKFDNDKKMFEFYGKGLFNFWNKYTNRVEEKSLFGAWASRFIYITDQLNIIEKIPNNECQTLVQLKKYSTDDLKDRNDFYAIGEEYEKYKEFGGGKYKNLELRFHSSSDWKEKRLYIPATDWKEIEIIKNNYEREKLFFGREEIKEVMVVKESPFLEKKEIPIIFVTNKNELLLAYHTKKGSAKKIPIITVTGVKINFKEAQYFLENHPLAEQIKKYSIYMNNRIHQFQNNEELNKANKASMNYWFDKLMLGASLQDELGSKEPEVKKSKKVKI